MPKGCSGLQVTDGQHPAVVGVRGGQAAFAEDVPTCFSTGALGTHQDPGDRGVGAALSHQGEHVAFSGGERAEPAGAAAGAP